MFVCLCVCVFVCVCVKGVCFVCAERESESITHIYADKQIQIDRQIDASCIDHTQIPASLSASNDRAAALT